MATLKQVIDISEKVLGDIFLDVRISKIEGDYMATITAYCCYEEFGGNIILNDDLTTPLDEDDVELIVKEMLDNIREIEEIRRQAERRMQWKD